MTQGVEAREDGLRRLDLAAAASHREGLSRAEAQRRLELVGPNALRSHGARPLTVLVRQLHNPLLLLLLAAALTSAFVGERRDALIIFLIKRPRPSHQIRIHRRASRWSVRARPPRLGV